MAGVGALCAFGFLNWFISRTETGLALLSPAIGYPVFRLCGHYVAIATIAVGEIMQTLGINWA